MNLPNRFSTTACNAALAMAGLWLCAVPAVAQPADQPAHLGLRPSQTQDTQPTVNSDVPPETESIDWSALNWDASRLPLPGGNQSSWQAPALAKPDFSFDRTEKRDGSSAVTMKKALPTDWDSKVGIDMTVPHPPTTAMTPIDADQFLPGTTTQSSNGAAWASVTAPALNVPAGWDKATIDARFDPTQEQRKIGTSVSKSVPLNERFSVTLQNGYAMTHAPSTLSTASGTFTAPPQPGVTGTTNSFSSENSAKLNLLPTGTSFSVGTALSTADEKWRRSVGACLLYTSPSPRD